MNQSLFEKVRKQINNAAESVDMDQIKELLERSPILLSVLSRVKKLAPHIESIRSLFQMLSDYMSRHYHISWHNVVLIVATLLYILNPIDVIPDAVPIVGYLDDVAALTFLLHYLQSEIARYTEWKQAGAR